MSRGQDQKEPSWPRVRWSSRTASLVPDTLTRCRGIE